MPILNWLLVQHAAVAFAPQWADLRRLLRPPRDLRQRVIRAVELYPCDLLFVHRDAERAPRAARVAEIRAVLEPTPPAVCVVPVRMQEAWLLFDEAAVREAAGKPTGRISLRLPPLRRAEAVPDPKRVLHQALIAASGLGGRKRRQFPVRERVHRLATLLQDFSPLRALPGLCSLRGRTHSRTARPQMGVRVWRPTRWTLPPSIPNPVAFRAQVHRRPKRRSR